jgi:hypothetical protein
MFPCKPQFYIDHWVIWKVEWVIWNLEWVIWKVEWVILMFDLVQLKQNLYFLSLEWVI